MKCLVITENTIAGCLELLEKYSGKTDMAEIRADFLDLQEMEKCAELPKASRIPLILTFRTPADGGRFKGPEEERIRLYMKGLEGGFAYIDLEEWLDAPELDKKAAAEGTVIVRSFHDFKTVPENLEERIRDLPRNKSEIAKAAVFPRSTADFFRVCRAALNLGGLKKVVLGMGEFGFPTRILARRLGCEWSYCAKNGNVPAPGHVSPELMEEVYNYSELTAETAIFGIIGNPVMHTRSPYIHNPGFRYYGLDAVYLPFLVDSVKDFFMNAGLLDIKGVSVTVPHKKAILEIASEVSKEAGEICSANTMIRQQDGWKAYNTDAAGVMKALKEVSLNGIKALVIGAGGTAPTIVHALKEAGCRVFITNRTYSKAEKIAEEFGIVSMEREQACRNKFDLVVQAGSAGMHPHEDMDPLPDFKFSGKETVFDVIYAPEKTKFLKRAEKSGCMIINGLPMLTGQAEEQFRLFCGRELPE